MQPLLLQGCAAVAPIAAPHGLGGIVVLGIGHLAAAVRVELARRGVSCEDAVDGRPLVVACSDFHNPASFREITRLAAENGSPTLFVCLTEATPPPSLLARARAAGLVDHIAHLLAQNTVRTQ